MYIGNLFVNKLKFAGGKANPISFKESLTLHFRSFKIFIYILHIVFKLFESCVLKQVCCIINFVKTCWWSF